MRTFVGMLLLAAVSAPEVTWACECDRFQFIAPRRDVEAPPDTRIWADFFSDDDVTLTTTTGAQIMLADERVLSVSTFWIKSFRPDSDLVPGREYEIHRDGRVLSRFRVRAYPSAPDRPPVPDVEFGDAVAETHHCGTTAGFPVLISEPAFLFVADANGSATFDGSVPGGRVSDLFIRGSTFLGESSCRRTHRPNDIVTVRYGALDVRGRFSGWSEPETVIIPAPGGCVCTKPSPGVWQEGMLLGLLIPLIFRWRRAAI